MRPRIYLHAGKHTAVLQGHPWIFAKAFSNPPASVKTGDLVNVYDAEKNWLGLGVFNSTSLYRVRMLALASEVEEETALATILTLRFKQALMLRHSLNLPSTTTNSYRFFNSEADGLSGLTIDCFNDVYVIASSAFWVELNKSLIQQVLNEVINPKTIIWRSQVKPLLQDGFECTQTDITPYSSQILEAGVTFAIQFDDSQKTGLFLDQRENHQRIAALASGKKVLDLYTYTGGFALHAAKAGAHCVTAIDSSEAAITAAVTNAELNNVSVNFLVGDARDYLNQAGDYDLVILDPPKLVPSKAHMNRAKNYYRFLHREVFKVMKSGSLLMTCNCSSALNAVEFTKLVSSQALAVDKQVRILGVYGPAACHPTLAHFPEGNYLTAVLIAVI